MAEPNKISNAIKAYLAQNGISGKEAAARLGFSNAHSVYNRLSSGKFNFESAYPWAEAFGFNMAFLLRGEGELVGANEITKLKMQVKKLREENKRLKQMLKDK